jgi:aminoglycoside 3-N-acetyltransferase
MMLTVWAGFTAGERMAEQDVIRRTSEPLTAEALAAQLVTAGLTPGSTAIVHVSVSTLGWVVGGAQAVVQALLGAVGPSGTLLMSTQTWRNLDPASGAHGSIPAAWWPLVREHWPAYDPATTPSIGMGQAAELFRTWPGAQRSTHPTRSFAALGPEAVHLLATHALEEPFGEGSPVGKLYALDGLVVLLGVDHYSNTSLHLAEHRARYASKSMVQESSAVLVDGVRQWITYSSPNLNDSHDFAQLGQAYEAAHHIAPTPIGLGQLRVLRQRPLVDWAVGWLEQHRT